MGLSSCSLFECLCFFSQKRNGNQVARVPKTPTPLGKIVLRVSDYSLKRASLTGVAESDVSAVGKTAEPDGMVLSDIVCVKVNH
jgi:hypothetical protein